VLSIHGRSDETCPPRWARQTQRAMVAAGVDAALEWYDDHHAFGPAFIEAMDSAVRFLRAA
jgi:predicted esterase